MGLLPSRVVAYVDELEDRGYVERRRNPDDRRLHALYLTASGKKVMTKIGELGRQHDRLLTAGLDAQQRDTLRQLLATDRRAARPYATRSPGLSRARTRHQFALSQPGDLDDDVQVGRALAGVDAFQRWTSE